MKTVMMCGRKVEMIDLRLVLPCEDLSRFSPVCSDCGASANWLIREDHLARAPATKNRPALDYQYWFYCGLCEVGG